MATNSLPCTSLATANDLPPVPWFFIQNQLSIKSAILMMSLIIPVGWTSGQGQSDISLGSNPNSRILTLVGVGMSPV